METNKLPPYDMTVNNTGCCPKFNPEGWDYQELHFKDKKFVKATTRSLMHVPVNMGKVFSRVHEHIDAAGDFDADNFLVLSRDTSAWESEHFFSVSKDIPDEEMATLSGDYITRVFEGPYKEAKNWCGEMENLVQAKGSEPGNIYFFYTTCPKCAKAYGQNYVVGVAEV